MRYSSRREAILNVMRSTKSHPDAEWVYERVRETIPNISLGTVYRNLREMSDAGVLARVETENCGMRFDADTSAHGHFVCRSCGEVSDVFDLDGGEAQLSRRGYTVERVKTVAYGICPHCAAKACDTTI